MELRVINETPKTITFEWDPVPDASGFVFYLDGVKKSNTDDGSRTMVKFRKAETYKVVALKEMEADFGVWPAAPAPDPTPDPTPEPDPTPIPDPTPDPVPPPPLGLTRLTGNIGSREISKPVLVEEAIFGALTFVKGSEGSIVRKSTGNSFNIFGASNLRFEDTLFKGHTDHCLIWDRAGVVPNGLTFERCTFENFSSSDAQAHTEALYVGYSRNGLIKDCTFNRNGNTSHIFFTWFGETANPSVSYPRNWTVEGCHFGPTAGAYYSVNLREEIPVSSNIRVERHQQTTAALISNPAFLYG